MAERLNDEQKLDLLDTWLGCDPVAGERLWRQPGLIENKCLEDHWIDILRKWCRREFSPKSMYFFKRCWDYMDAIDQEAMAREVVQDWQNRVKRWDGSGGKRPGSYPEWAAFCGYLSDSCKNIMDHLERWNRALPTELRVTNWANVEDDDAFALPEPKPDLDATSPAEYEVDSADTLTDRNRQARGLIDEFAATLTNATALLPLLQCMQRAYDWPVDVVFLLDATRSEASEERERMRECAFAAGMSQCAYNQNTTRLRKHWRAFRESDGVRPLWEALRDALRQ